MVFRPHYRLLCALSLVANALTFSPAATAQVPGTDLFTGTVRLACEALICLSSSAGGATPDCNPALSYFYGIQEEHLSDTLEARLNFLRQCPDASQTPEMKSLVEALADGSGRCDATSLNRALRINRVGDSMENWVKTDNRLPSYCRVYMHDYSDLGESMPRYVGTVNEWGYWVEPKQYTSALVKYKAMVKARKRKLELESYSYGN